MPRALPGRWDCLGLRWMIWRGLRAWCGGRKLGLPVCRRARTGKICSSKELRQVRKFTPGAGLGGRARVKRVGGLGAVSQNGALCDLFCCFGAVIGRFLASYRPVFASHNTEAAW